MVRLLHVDSNAIETLINTQIRQKSICESTRTLKQMRYNSRRPHWVNMDQISEEYFFHLVVSVPEELVQF